MSDSDWWRPENLQRAEQASRKITKVTELDFGGDFGTYRRLVLGGTLEEAQAHQHNELNPITNISSICRLLKITNPTSILDLGCGLGFTTEAFATLHPNAQVFGLDVSIDAIAYAQRTHQKATFQVALIDLNYVPQGKFDLIFCNEFYPFTRNRDAQFQANLITSFSRSLEKSGIIVIGQSWRTEESLPRILREVKQLCPELKFQVRRIPHPILASKLPLKFGIPLSGIIGFILNKELLKKVIVVRKTHSN